MIKINQNFVSTVAFILMLVNVHFNMELTHWYFRLCFQIQVQRCALKLCSLTVLYKGETGAIAKSSDYICK